MPDCNVSNLRTLTSLLNNINSPARYNNDSRIWSPGVHKLYTGIKKSESSNNMLPKRVI